METITKKIKENIFILIGIFIGGISGFLYWHFVGCLDGTCPVNASPVMNIIRGAAIGALLFAFIDSFRKKII